ncbi:MAG: hypothetical protein C4K58_06960 [Flavobacteriaceae bacterium]|nr:MAG: hypothetical protein C4K58_06960 [Flavobacteriaceae bacterium]
MSVYKPNSCDCNCNGVDPDVNLPISIGYNSEVKFRWENDGALTLESTYEFALHEDYFLANRVPFEAPLEKEGNALTLEIKPKEGNLIQGGKYYYTIHETKADGTKLRLFKSTLNII